MSPMPRIPYDRKAVCMASDPRIRMPSATSPRRRLAALLLASAALPWTGCLGASEGPLQVRAWGIHVHDPWNVTFSFTVVNEGRHAVRMIESHLSPEQFDPAPDGGVRYGVGGHVLESEYPATAKGRTALFNDSEVLQPGESRRFWLRAHYPPDHADMRPDDTYEGYVNLDYESNGKIWRTGHGSPCLKADGTPGEGVECGRRYEAATPVE